MAKMRHYVLIAVGDQRANLPSYRYPIASVRADTMEDAARQLKGKLRPVTNEDPDRAQDFGERFDPGPRTLACIGTSYADACLNPTNGRKRSVERRRIADIQIGYIKNFNHFRLVLVAAF